MTRDAFQMGRVGGTRNTGHKRKFQHCWVGGFSSRVLSGNFRGTVDSAYNISRGVAQNTYHTGANSCICSGPQRQDSTFRSGTFWGNVGNFDRNGRSELSEVTEGERERDRKRRRRGGDVTTEKEKIRKEAGRKAESCEGRGKEVEKESTNQAKHANREYVL
eukprot:762747-Hanusia_phi.AAC.2